MKPVHLFSVFQVLMFARIVLSMTNTEFGKFLYTLAANFTIVQINRPQTMPYTGHVGYESLRPVMSVPAIQTECNSDDRYFYSQYASTAHIPNLHNNGVIRVAYRGGNAVLTHRNFKGNVNVPTTSEEKFQEFFRTLQPCAFQPLDEPCQHSFNFQYISRSGTGYKSKSYNCKAPMEITFTCSQRFLTEFGGAKGYYSVMLTSNTNYRYTVPKSWNVSPC